jgi:hypothetical protein
MRYNLARANSNGKPFLVWVRHRLRVILGKRAMHLPRINPPASKLQGNPGKVKRPWAELGLNQPCR